MECIIDGTYYNTHLDTEVVHWATAGPEQATTWLGISARPSSQATKSSLAP